MTCIRLSDVIYKEIEKRHKQIKTENDVFSREANRKRDYIIYRKNDRKWWDRDHVEARSLFKSFWTSGDQGPVYNA